LRGREGKGGTRRKGRAGKGIWIGRSAFSTFWNYRLVQSYALLV